MTLFFVLFFQDGSFFPPYLASIEKFHSSFEDSAMRITL